MGGTLCPQADQRFLLPFLLPVFFRGTFAPFLRASLRPIAIACFRLLTFRPEPLFSVPFFLRCIADLTLFLAALPYLAMLRLNARDVLSQRVSTGVAHQSLCRAGR